MAAKRPSNQWWNEGKWLRFFSLWHVFPPHFSMSPHRIYCTDCLLTSYFCHLDVFTWCLACHLFFHPFFLQDHFLVCWYRFRMILFQGHIFDLNIFSKTSFKNMAWNKNHHLSRRLYASLCDAAGRLRREALGAALSEALAEGCSSAASTWSLAKRGAEALVPWMPLSCETFQLVKQGVTFTGGKHQKRLICLNIYWLGVNES